MTESTPVEITLDAVVRRLEPLSDEDRQLIEALRRTKVQAEIAKEFGWTRSKVWHRIQSLKKRAKRP